MNHKIEINWRELYNQNEQVRRLADKIHNSRMLAPPACDQCIEMAVSQIRKDNPSSDPIEWIGFQTIYE